VEETVTAGIDASDRDGLAGLRLSPGDRTALARQGFVSTEFREGRRPFYKLRWRRGGRQHTRYLGQEPARAERVRAALDRLQRPYRVAVAGVEDAEQLAVAQAAHVREGGIPAR
jgi:hypothetical protein